MLCIAADMYAQLACKAAGIMLSVRVVFTQVSSCSQLGVSASQYHLPGHILTMPSCLFYHFMRYLSLEYDSVGADVVVFLSLMIPLQPGLFDML